MLALLAKEPSHGYQLRARLRQALGPLGDAMNDGQVYVTLTRLEKAGLVASERAAGLPDRPDRKVYALTAAGQQRVAGWLAEVSWPRPDLAEFHLKLIAAAAAGLADPIAIVDAQRRELLRRLRDAQRAEMAEPDPPRLCAATKSAVAIPLPTRTVVAISAYPALRRPRRELLRRRALDRLDGPPPAARSEESGTMYANARFETCASRERFINGS